MTEKEHIDEQAPAPENIQEEAPAAKSIIFDEVEEEETTEQEKLQAATPKAASSVEEMKRQGEEWSRKILTDAFKRSVITGLVVTTFVAIFLAIFWPEVIVVVRSGEKAVKYKLFQGGVEMDRVYPEGIHFLPPWNDMFKYNIRIQEHTDSVNALSKDGLDIKVGYTVLHRPKQDELPFLHRNIGVDYVRKVITPMSSASVREVISQFRPQELYSMNRNLIQELILETLLNKAGDRHIEYVDVMIKSIVLPPSISKAIEDKLVEEQKELMFDYKLIVERKEAERKLVEALGIKTFTDSAGIDIMKWRGLEVTEKMAQSPNSKVIVIGTNDKDLPIILGGN